MTAGEAHTRLAERSREAALAGSLTGLLNWDQETFMPRRAAAHRAAQLAWTSGRAHALWTAPEVGHWLEACGPAGAGEDDRSANLRAWRRDHDRAVKLPVELVEECARAEAAAHHAWLEARERADFTLFAPHLGRLVELARHKADLWGYVEEPYDALLEGYEPGARAGEIAEVFGKLEGPVEVLVREGERGGGGLPEGPYPVEAQQRFNRRVAEACGFDFTAGRIDTSAHPFCSGLGPGDCRLTTRYDPADFTKSLYGVLHECGHGLYDQGLPEEHWGTPLGADVSMGIHESQSRLWENHVGRSRAFWEHWFPVAAEMFPVLRSTDAEGVWRHANRVGRSFIRVDADEVTYDLHIVLRFRVERALVAGELEAAGVPALWNAQFRRLLGLEVPDDARGCLQDIHWSMGGFGYFPTYTLGNLNAAQLIAAARRQIAGLERGLAAGNYGDLLGWLRKNIHAHGRCYLPGELMERVTGSKTSAEDYLEHLKTIIT